MPSMVRACLKPWIYALAARGESGLTSLLQTIKNEMDVAMALSGTTEVAGLTPEILDRTRE